MESGGRRAGRLGRAAASLAVGALALALCAALGEQVLRWRFEPVDFLLPELRADARLPFAVVPGSAGHDAWGFRNLRVPERAEIVAIGDSQTYGLSAPRSASWPAQLERLRGERVYNLALGGYGPPDYLTLLRDYAPRLAPREIVIALYPGNDLWRSWQDLRGIAPELPAAAPDTRPLGALRSWLARHSLLYQVTKHALPGLADSARLRLAAVDSGRELIVLDAGARSTAFDPEVRLDVLDLEREPVRRGLEHTLELLDAMHAHCDALRVRCRVLLVPTKESVYADLVEAQLSGEGRRRVLAAARAEARVCEALCGHERSRGRPCINALAELQHALAAGRPLYSPSHDGHPSAEGYAVIARVVAAALDAPGPDPGTGIQSAR